MKGILVALLLLVSIKSFSQQLVKYSIDKDVSINLPDNSVLTDTLGQKMIKGNISGINVIFLRALEKDKKTIIESKADLIDFYTGFQKGYAQSVNGKIVKSKIIDKDNLKASLFECKTKMNNLHLSINGLVVFLNNYAYTVQFFNVGAGTADYEAQKKNHISFFTIS